MKIRKSQLKQIIKEELEATLSEHEVLAQEGLMDFLRDPTGRKARAEVDRLTKVAAQATSEAEKLKAEKEKAALEKAAEEQGLLDKARADYAQTADAEDTARRQREKKYHADLKKFVPGTRNFIDDFRRRRAHYFNMAEEFKGLYSFPADGVPREMTLGGTELGEYVFVRPQPDREKYVAERLEHDVAKNRGMTGGSGDRRFPTLFGEPAYYNYDDKNILIVDPESNIYVSYADYRDSDRYRGDLNQNALYRAIIDDLENRGYVQTNALPVPASPEYLRDLRGKQ